MYLVEGKYIKKLILSLFCLTNNGGSLFFLYLFNILKVFMSKYYMGSESYLDGTLKKNFIYKRQRGKLVILMGFYVFCIFYMTL